MRVTWALYTTAMTVMTAVIANAIVLMGPRIANQQPALLVVLTASALGIVVGLVGMAEGS